MKIGIILAAALALPACASQSYARLEPVSSAEAVQLSCERIDAELIRAEGFRREVRDGARAPWWAAPKHLTDIAFGNAHERAEASQSAERRIAQLQEARRGLGCPAPPAAPGA